MLLASARLRRAVLPTLGWGKQSTWLAASGSLAHLQARPAPTPGREVDTTGRPLSRPCRPCVPLSGRGRVNTQGSPISGGVFSTCGRCFLKSRQAECSHENSEKERLRGSPVSGPLGAFDFRTRIKGGGRKRPPPGHKAPQCGAFPAFEEGAPFRHSRRFQVVGDLRNPVFPAGSGLFDRRRGLRMQNLRRKTKRDLFPPAQMRCR